MGKRRLSFLNEVRDQIKSREAKDFVEVELDYHIKEAKSHLLAKGIDEEEAEEKAVGQMGSPVMLGQQLNKLHRPKVDWLTVILLVITLGLGFIPILFVDPDYSSQIGVDASYFSKNKGIFSLLGGAVAVGMMLMDYRKLAKFGWLFYGIGMLILVVLQIFPSSSHGVPVIDIGPYRVMGLTAIPFFLLAWAFFFNHKKLKLWQLSLLFILSCYLFFMTSTIPTTYIYAVMVFVMLWWSQFSRKTILITISVMVSLLFFVGLGVWQFDVGVYSLKNRFLAFINPEKYAEGPGYLILLIKERMSEAGWLSNASNHQVIPDVHTDLVFVGFTYYYGWLAALALVCILLLFVARIMVIARKINDPFGKLLLIGAVALYTVQLVSNITMTLGLFPITSISLPFISYGLMPILFNAFVIGIVLSVYRRKDLTSSSLSQIESSQS
ncbi:FtsW/RodA/SpoVE family cell cycle protein [Sporosarcina sp. FSL K6-1508]|uniref:FtsW/RodA/SpoVE family cell cycle protein n=1 Tax=Sporosarcina sp. FSL K6-1508 TaxID=2921553 RepID=UPI0030FC855A